MKLQYGGENGIETFTLSFSQQRKLDDWMAQILERVPSRYRDASVTPAPPAYYDVSPAYSTVPAIHIYAPAMERSTPPLQTASQSIKQEQNPFDTYVTPCRPSLVSTLSDCSIMSDDQAPTSTPLTPKSLCFDKEAFSLNAVEAQSSQETGGARKRSQLLLAAGSFALGSLASFAMIFTIARSAL